jgi:hypothetical protein
LINAIKIIGRLFPENSSDIMDYDDGKSTRQTHPDNDTNIKSLSRHHFNRTNYSKSKDSTNYSILSKSRSFFLGQSYANDHHYKMADSVIGK